MTDLSFSHLPLAAGSALISGTGRAGAWALRRYLRAPLATSAILALAALSLAGAAHALYFESGRHPAPLFNPGPTQGQGGQRLTAPLPAPARPTVHRKISSISAIISGDVTGSVSQQGATTATGPIGHAEVAAIQQKLATLGFFAGRVDGFYGPKTAKAIRAFEQGAGMQPKGTLDRAVLEAILAAPLPGSASAPIRMAAVQPPTVGNDAAGTDIPLPAALPAELEAQHASAQPLAAGPRPLAAPAPGAQQPMPRQVAAAPQLRLASAPVTEQSLPPPAARPAEPPKAVKIGPVDGTPEQILDAAGATAANAFNALAGMVAEAAGQRGGPAQPEPRPAVRVAAASAPAKLALQPSPALQPPPAPAPEAPGSQIAEASPDQVAPGDGAPPVAATLAIPSVPTAVATAPINPEASSTDPVLVTKVQRGLASLGFLAGKIDGVASESTAKAIRNFEVYYNYPVTGRVTPELVGLLQQAGAVI